MLLVSFLPDVLETGSKDKCGASLPSCYNCNADWIYNSYPEQGHRTDLLSSLAWQAFSCIVKDAEKETPKKNDPFTETQIIHASQATTCAENQVFVNFLKMKL